MKLVNSFIVSDEFHQTKTEAGSSIGLEWATYQSVLIRLLDDTEMPKEEHFFAALEIPTCVIFVVRPKK